MQKLYKTVIKIILITVVVLWMIDKSPFNQKINHEITVNLYRDNSVIGQTTVIIEGEKSNYLLHNVESYWGKFQILSYEKSTRDDIHAAIDWNGENNTQTIFYRSPGMFPDMDIMHLMLINEEMTQFVFAFSDGTILATSDELQQLYQKHVTIHNPTAMSISDITDIPKIK